MNLLKHEDSPYLQQHKNNPVDWMPWCDEAFERAKKENKSIFISIGYSSCHWCHVMENKVFENETIAKHLNEHFISIKVDKEERPDIDKYYQDVHLLLNRRAGGWPTSIFCTPQNKPFFAATYIPPESKDRELGFSELIEIISTKVAQNDAKLFENADEIQGFLKPDDRPTQASQISIEIAQKFIKQSQQNFELDFGGFSSETKFPNTSTLNALFNFSRIHLDEDSIKEANDMLFHTMDNMILGGMYDHVDGGFCRYSVDKEWLVPHFEKMCYDNGLLISLYAQVGKYHDRTLYIDIAKQSADFMTNKMMKENLFYSASDADTNGVEGDYFTYTYDELSKAFENIDNKDDILKELNITKDGNFEGKNIIRFLSDKSKKSFLVVKDTLEKIREDREYPFIDKKIQTSWNSMMIKALFDLAILDNSYLNQAVTSLNTLLDKMYHDKILYHTSLLHKTPKVEAYLEDYAYLGVALVAAYEVTFNIEYLTLAQELTNVSLEKFFDKGRWYFSRGEFITDAEIGDGTYTSSISIMIDLLLTLGALIDDKYEQFAANTLEYYSYKMVKSPMRTPHMSCMAIRYHLGDIIVKSSAKNLKKIEKLNYPYTLKQEYAETKFMLCKIGSCFAQTDDSNNLNTLIEKIV